MFDVLSQLLRGATSQFKTNDPFVADLVQWIGALQESAFTKWRSVAASGIRCTGKMHFKNVGSVPCPHPAISACGACRHPTCMGHSFVSIDGTVVCGPCVGKFCKAVKDGKFSVAGEASWSPGQENIPDAGPVPDDLLRAKHLKNLGLSAGATWSEINTAFRDISKKKHPDKSPPAKRQAAEAKYKIITESFQWLRDNTPH